MGHGNAVLTGRWRGRLGDTLLWLAPVLGFFLLWEFFSRSGVIDPELFPPPSLILGQAIVLGGPNDHPVLSYLLWRNLAISGVRVAIGFVFGAGVGVVLGLMMGTWKPFYWFFRPILALVAPIPTYAIAPALLIILGRGDKMVITVIFLAALIPTMFNTMDGPRSVSRHHVWAIQMMGAGPWQVFTRVLLPGSAAYVLTGLRQAIGFSWRSLVVAEMMGATSGIGYMIFAARQFLVVTQMFVGIVMLGVAGFLTETLIFGYIEQRTIRRWGLVRP